MARKITAFLAAFALMAQDAAFARQPAPSLPPNVELTWDELAAVLVEQKIATVLADGTKLKGEVLAVRPESLVLDVAKTSRRKAWPLGQSEILRTALTSVDLIRERSAGWRILGGLLGGIGGLFGTGALAYAANSVAVLPFMLLIIPLGAVAGYYAGKIADQHTTHIRIRPEAGEEQE
jgi:hypothetical protein